MHLLQSLYDPLLADARSRFAQNEALAAALRDDVDPDLLELFFIHFCAIGVRMTAPVEGWIRRAGERCAEVGLAALGAALVAHARHEAGHDRMMAADVHTLVRRRRAAGRSALDASELLALPEPRGVRAYVELHERTIAGDAPFAQIAIEYEIERLSAPYGGRLLARCAAVLGRDALAGLSFLEEHAALDVGHTHLNATELARLLASHPEHAKELAAAGSAALDAYGAFLDDCLALTRARCAR